MKTMQVSFKRRLRSTKGVVKGGSRGPGPHQFLEQQKEVLRILKCINSRFASVVLDVVLEPFLQKQRFKEALQCSEMETRELLGGTCEKIVIPIKGQFEGVHV